MSRVRHNNLFRWTLRGRPYLMIAGSGLALLMRMMGVL